MVRISVPIRGVVNTLSLSPGRIFLPLFQLVATGTSLIVMIVGENKVYIIGKMGKLRIIKGFVIKMYASSKDNLHIFG